MEVEFYPGFFQNTIKYPEREREFRYRPCGNFPDSILSLKGAMSFVVKFNARIESAVRSVNRLHWILCDVLACQYLIDSQVDVRGIMYKFPETPNGNLNEMRIASVEWRIQCEKQFGFVSRNKVIYATPKHTEQSISLITFACRFLAMPEWIQYLRILFGETGKNVVE